MGGRPGANQGEVLSKNDFQRAVQALDVGWTVETSDNVYNKIDQQMNRQMAQG
jgi:hypothetical protein